MVIRLVTLAVLAGGVSAAPVPKSLKAAPSLNGTWDVTEQHSRGRPVNRSYVTRWVIIGESLSIERVANGNAGPVPQPVNQIQYSLVKPAGVSNGIDYTITLPNGTTRAYRGIFDLSKDTLTVCYTVTPDGDRPTECRAGDTTMLYVFKRVTGEK
jgi:uncharacterized protein (TIGR03067 family)